MKLQFTNGYRPHFDQISRIMQYLLRQEGRKRIPRQELISNLGIPDKQIENLTSMMTGFGLLPARSIVPTTLGKVIITYDPYFENIKTLWIIHYVVSSNPTWVVWHRVINQVIQSEDHFEVGKVSSQYFTDLTEHFSARTISEKLPNEISAVFASYTRTELSKLNLLAIDGNGKFIKTVPIDIPPTVMLYCLLHFRDSYSPGSTALNVADVSRQENSPGRVLNLAEYQVRESLGKLHSAGLLRLEQFANLDQIRLLSISTQEEALEQVYRG